MPRPDPQVVFVVVGTAARPRSLHVEAATLQRHVSYCEGVVEYWDGGETRQGILRHYDSWAAAQLAALEMLEAEMGHVHREWTVAMNRIGTESNHYVWAGGERRPRMIAR